MELNDAIITLEKENKWYYQDEGKSVMVNNSALHEAISTVLDHIKSESDSSDDKFRVEIPSPIEIWNKADDLSPIEFCKWYRKMFRALIKEMPSGIKLYRCTNCQTVNAKIDNGEIRVGFCDKCDHPLWNPVKKDICPYCGNPNPHLYGDEGGYCEECNKDWKNKANSHQPSANS